MTTIHNITNSFIQFGGGGDIVIGSSIERDVCYAACPPPSMPCLPMHDITDIAFQIVISGFTEQQRTDFTVALYAGSDCPEEIDEGTGTVIETWVSDDLQLISLGNDDYLLLFDVEDALNLCETLRDGECLKLILFDAGLDTVYACSNCLYFTKNTCYTKLVRYRNLENAFGFYYEEAGAAFYNRIRLNITVHSPQFPVTKNVFRLSDGSYKKLSAFLQKEYECMVDYLDENLHQSIVVFLEHDLVYLYNEESATWEKRTNTEDQEYKIDWLNKPGAFLKRGKANFKLNVDPFFNQNSNC